MIDNALNAADVRTRNFVNGLQPLAESIKTNEKIVRATHQITELHLIRKQTLKYHKNSFTVPVMALEIYSQLVSANLTPNHTTNIVNIKGQPSDLKSRYHQHDEKAIYVLNANEVVNVIKSGAYDHADAWDRALNSSLDGMQYERPTDVGIRQVHMVANPNISMHHYGRPHRRASITATMVRSDLNVPYFAASTTDNDFTFIFADTMNTLYKENQANDDGFRIDKAIVHDANKRSKNYEGVNDEVKSVFTNGHVDLRKLKKHVETAYQNKNHKIDKSIVNPDDIARVAKSNAKKRSLNAQRDHITKTAQAIKNPLNLNPKRKSNSTSHQKQSQKSITHQAQAVTHEINLNRNLKSNGVPYTKGPKDSKRLHNGLGDNGPVPD